MTRRILAVFTLLLLSIPAWSQQMLDHESSFAIELDKATGMWAMECELEVDGVNPLEDHRIYASVQYQVSGTTAITIAQSYFDIFGDERSKSELTSGQFAFEAKKMGDRLKVGITLSWPAAGAPQGEGFICGISAFRLVDGVEVYGGIARMLNTQHVFSY